MIFAHPYLLLLLLLAPVLACLAFLAERARMKKLRTFAGDLGERLARGGGRGLLRVAFRIGALGLLVVALADPRFGNKVEEMTRRGVDVLFVVDVSSSMLAEDVKPSRLQKAKAEIRHLIAGLEGDRLGLVVFAGLADPLVPLTTDRGAFELFLDLVDPGLIPVPGTDLGGALELALRLLEGEDLQYKVVVLVTDGEDHEKRGREVAEVAAARGIRIHTVNVGAGGAPIPDGQGGFKRDKEGEMVFSKPDVEGLSSIAAATGGGFYQASSPRIELGELQVEIASMEDRDLHSEEVTNKEERFQIPLALALLLLLFEFLLEPQRPEGRRRLA